MKTRGTISRTHITEHEININSLSEIDQNELIKENPFELFKLDGDPSEAAQLTAIRASTKMFSPANFLHEYFTKIRNPSERAQLLLVSNYSWTLSLIPQSSHRVRMVSLKLNPRNIAHIEHPNEQEQLLVVKQQPFLIGDIKHPTHRVQLAAVKKRPAAIKYINNPIEKAQLVAVKQDGYVVSFINEPSTAVQLAAVRQNPRALVHLMDAQAKNQLVIDQSVILLALASMGQLICLFDNPDAEMQLVAVHNDIKAIKHLENPTADVLAFVADQDISMLDKIINPSDTTRNVVEFIKSHHN